MKNKFIHRAGKFFSGFISVLGYIFFVFIAIGIVIAVSVETGNRMPDEMVLKLTLEDGLTETASDAFFMSGFSGDSAPLTVYKAADALHAAASDSRVKGLILNIKDGDYGYAGIQEIRNAVEDFKKSGKRVYSYGTSFGTAGSAMAPYYLASAADEITIAPMGTVGITGFLMQTPFFKGLFDKLGIVPDMIHKGDYKSAPESLMRTSMSPENKEMMQSIMDGYYRRFVADVAKSRKIDEKKLENAINEAPLSAGEAVKAGLIDAIDYKDVFIDKRIAEFGDIEWVDIVSYVPENKTGNKNRIDVVHIDGLITDNPGDGTMLGETPIEMKDIVQSLDDASHDDKCSAIVVRVNSPGGTPEAADELRRAIVKAGELKPLVVSMGDVAASGGYWVAVNARSIIASPMTLTGSIGVFGGKISVGGLLEKLGIRTDGIQIGKNADLYAPDKPYTPEQRKKVGVMMDEIYKAFVERVAFGRGLSVEKVNELAKGRVYTGEQALKIGLVDELGGLDLAVKKAAEAAGVPSEGIITIHYPGPRSVLDRISDILSETGMVYRAAVTAARSFGVNSGAALYENGKIY